MTKDFASRYAEQIGKSYANLLDVAVYSHMRPWEQWMYKRGWHKILRLVSGYEIEKDLQNDYLNLYRRNKFITKL